MRAIGWNQCWYSPFIGGPHQYVWAGCKITVDTKPPLANFQGEVDRASLFPQVFVNNKTNKVRLNVIKCN